MKISTGFLTDNLLINAGNGVNEYATAKRFAEQLTSAIAAQYPEAEVTVGWRRGSGFLPQELWTAVDYDPGHGEVGVVDQIVGDVIKRGDFYIHGVADSAIPEAGTTRVGHSQQNPESFPVATVSPDSAPRFLRSEKGVMEMFLQWMRGKASHS